MILAHFNCMNMPSPAIEPNTAQTAKEVNSADQTNSCSKYQLSYISQPTIGKAMKQGTKIKTLKMLRLSNFSDSKIS